MTPLNFNFRTHGQRMSAGVSAALGTFMALAIIDFRAFAQAFLTTSIVAVVIFGSVALVFWIAGGEDE